MLPSHERSSHLSVSKFGPRLAGTGGFIDISQNTKKSSAGADISRPSRA